MSRPFWIIDGYNLMHAAGMARHEYGPHELERRRWSFLYFLTSHLTFLERSRTCVVFDALAAPHGLPQQENESGLKIVFARPGTDADALIEMMLAHHSAPRQVIMVSSDHRLQKAARSRKARWQKSETYFNRLEKRGPLEDGEEASSEPNPKYEGELSESEIERWKSYFGPLPALDQLLPEPPPIVEPLPKTEPPSSPHSSSKADSKSGASSVRKPRRKNRSQSQKVTSEEEVIAQGELEEWLEIFGNIPEAAELIWFPRDGKK